MEDTQRSRFYVMATGCTGAVLLLFSTTHSYAASESVHSRHFRTAETVETPADDQRLEAVSKGNGSARWVFNALGKNFDVDLTSNARLVSKMNAQARSKLLAKHRLFRGKLRGNSSSWVRLTQSGAAVSGMIWDGSELFVVEDAVRSQSRRASGERLSRGNRQLVVYRYSDTLQNELLSCETVDGQATADSQPGSLNEIGSHIRDGLNPEAIAALAGVLDVDLVDDGRVGSSAVEIFNVVDGIYSDQLGVGINIARSEVVPLACTGSDLMTNTFRNYMRDRGTIGAGHLLTACTNTGWAGQAYLSRLCDTFALGASRKDLGFSSSVTIVAHELGHNFSARHDQDEGCERGLIMDAFVSGSQTFSGSGPGPGPSAGVIH